MNAVFSNALCSCVSRVHEVKMKRNRWFQKAVRLLIVGIATLGAASAWAAMTVKDIESTVKPGERIEMTHDDLLKAVTGAKGKAKVMIVGPGAAGARGSLQLTADRVAFTAPAEETTVEFFFVVQDDVERVKGRWIIKVVKGPESRPAG
jgi:hypothetical protein